MAFGDLRQKSTVLQRCLRSDWTEQEKKFRDNLTHYISAISAGNPKISEKKQNQQPVAAQGVAASEENPVKKIEGKDNAPCVESSQANAESVKAERPIRPETTVSDQDDLNDLFDLPSDKAPKKEEKPSSAEADPFDIVPAEQTKWTPPDLPSSDRVPTTKSIDAEVASQMAAIGDEVKTAKKQKAEPEKKADKAEAKAEVVEKPPEKPLDGFIFDEFKEVQQIIANILSKVKKSDIDAISKMIPQFAVHIKLDRFAEHPAVISQAIAEVQHQLDSVHDQLMETGPESQALGAAWDYLGDIGVAFSSASNREKRMAQSKIVMRDLWQRYIEVKTIHTSLEKAYRHLQIQFDTLSRLITCEQERRSKELNRGGLPFDGSYKSVSEPEPKQAPQAPAQSAGESAALAQKYASLDGLPKEVKAVKKEEKGLIGGDELNF